MNASEMAGALLLAIAPETRLGLPRLHLGQQQVIADARRFNVLAAGRRWGKNTLAEGRVILPALQGKPAAWFSPTYKSLADDWRRLSEIQVPVTKSKNEQEHAEGAQRLSHPLPVGAGPRALRVAELAAAVVGEPAHPGG